MNEPDTWTNIEIRYQFANDEFPHRSLFNATALHYACLTGNFEIIEDLLKAGADWKKLDAHGRDPKAMFLHDPDDADRTRFQKLCEEYGDPPDPGATTGPDADAWVPPPPDAWGSVQAPDAFPPPQPWTVPVNDCEF